MVCGVLPTDLNAAVYRWVDEQGRVQFGDRPPPETNAKQVEVKKTSGTAPQPPASSGETMSERLKKQQRMLDAYRAEREQKKKLNQEKKIKKARQSKRCAYAKDRLKGYEGAGRTYRLTKDGNRHYLTDAEHKQSIARLKQKIAEACN